MNILEINHLKKYYGQQRGVQDVTFHIKPGEILGFIGPNGAGKSTTIRCILNLLYPTSGSIKVFGMDSIKDKVEIAKNIGYLPSEIAYYDNMKVIDLLNYSRSFYPSVNKDKMNELCQRLNLDVGRKINDLSLGNKKKVGIVQGLLHSPKFIILDEPTSGLDPLMQQTFFELLEEENKKGVTILFSSHILSEIKRLSHRIVLIKDGLIQDLEDLTQFNYKICHITSDEQTLAHLNQQLTLKEELGLTNTYYYQGHINDLLKVLNNYPIENLLIEDPSLDEIFLQYYRESK